MPKARKLAVISGGSRGLGAALCEEYLRSGYRVVEFSRSAPHSFSVSVDLAEPLQAQAVIKERLLELAGESEESIEDLVVINNAGLVTPIGPASRKEPRHLLGNINVNFASAILFIAQAIRAFQEMPGRKTVAHISSGASQKSYAGLSLYCAAKAGMENFVRAVASEQETEQHPFRAICIDPGVMDTDMQADIRGSSKVELPGVPRFVELKKFGELRDPVTVAGLVAKIIARNTRTGTRYHVVDFLE